MGLKKTEGDGLGIQRAAPVVSPQPTAEAEIAAVANFIGEAVAYAISPSEIGIFVRSRDRGGGRFCDNADKVRAALATAHLRAERVLAVYQPHGYGPTRFLRQDFVTAFASELKPDDRLWMLEIFYAGGTARRDFSAADIVAEIADRGVKAEFAPSRAWLAARIADEACAGDVVLVMGARDPSLTQFARDIVAAIDRRDVAASRKQLPQETTDA